MPTFAPTHTLQLERDYKIAFNPINATGAKHHFMSPLDQLNHLLNFIAPALVVGCLVAICARFLYKNKASGPALYAQAAINSVAGVTALGCGLWVFGNDGKMATYAGMVLACALVQSASMRR